MSFAGTQQKCKACDKTVYPMDQLTADGIIYHRACFRCKHCQGTLKLSNYASLDGVLYCKKHIDQRLKSTGSVGKSFEAGAQPKSLNKLQESPSEKNLGRSPSMRLFAGTQEKCGACSKTVYPLEQEKNLGRSSSMRLFAGTQETCGACSKTVYPLEKEKNLGRSPSMRLFAGTQEKCGACSKTVYPLEKVSVDGLPYHKSCFKCAHGGCVISPTNYAALEGRVYCKHHYSQLFKEKGNYSQLVKAPSLKLGPKLDA